MILLLLSAPYIEIPYPLGKLLVESTVVTVMRVEKVDRQQNAIIYRKVQDLKGAHPTELIKHNIGRAGFHEREWKTIMEWAEPGKLAVFIHNGGASETCIDTYWYQSYAGGEWWNMSHGEPYLLRTFAGRPEKLALAIGEVLAGREVIVPSMIDGDKNSLQLRTAKVQRMRASLKIQEYNPQRDFVGWGNEDFRRIAGMPGFTHMAGLSRVDPGARGIAASDFDGDGDADFCLFGENKTALIKNEGSAMNELALPYSGAARGADWADYNGDGKPDLLLAAPTGPRLLTHAGESFRDDSAGLPARPYYTVSAAAWIDYDADKRPDILLANGFLGLRLYRNLGTGGEFKPPTLGPWHVVGPFDNGGIAQAHPPEKGVDLKATYPGKGGAKIGWEKRDFPDGQVHSLAIFKDNVNCVAYLAREIEAPSAVDLPVSFGSDDSLVVLLNGQRILAEDAARAAAPDQNLATLHLRPGKNMLLLRIGQGEGEFAFTFAAKPPQPATGPLFEDVTQKAGLGSEGIGGTLKGDHLLVADVNRDGRSDFLFGAGTGLLALGSAKGFVLARDSGISYRAGGISPAFGDFDGDGDLDLFVPQKERSLLLRNEGGGKFADITAASGDLAAGVGSAHGAVWVDLYKSGKPDLLVGCLGGPNRFFRNGGGGRFKESSDRLGLSRRVFNSRAVAAVDLNKDGTTDLLFNNEGQEPVALLGDPARTGMRVEFAPEVPVEAPRRLWARAALATGAGFTLAIAGAAGIALAFRRRKT